MTITLIHSADLQLGRSFAGFPADTAHALKEARLAVLDRLADAARTNQAAHILVAGDVFDAEFLAPATLRQPLARMRAHPSITWHLLPGNHDPHRPGGVWERLVADGLPANVRPWLTPEPAEIAPGIWLLPAPLTAKSVSRDPTGYMDSASTPPGVIRIGLAHGSIKDFGSQREASVRIAPDRPRRAGLAYLALGDWHGALKISERAWYSGTPETDRFNDTESGLALAVVLAGPAKLPVVTKLNTGHFVWRQMSMRADDAAAIDRLEQELRQDNDKLDRLLLKLTVTGSASLAGRAGITAALDRLAPALRFLDVSLVGLLSKPQSDDFDRLRRHGAIGEIALQLQGMTVNPADPEAAIAAEALQQLFALTATLEQGS
jgi:DNA repair exonuclease SbcCD nuclease subunit